MAEEIEVEENDVDEEGKVRRKAEMRKGKLRIEMWMRKKRIEKSCV